MCASVGLRGIAQLVGLEVETLTPDHPGRARSAGETGD